VFSDRRYFRQAIGQHAETVTEFSGVWAYTPGIGWRRLISQYIFIDDWNI
jgi:hypothetical protein